MSLSAAALDILGHHDISGADDVAEWPAYAAGRVLCNSMLDSRTSLPQAHVGRREGKERESTRKMI